MDQNIEYSDGEDSKTKPVVPKVKKFIEKHKQYKEKLERKEKFKQMQKEKTLIANTITDVDNSKPIESTDQKPVLQNFKKVDSLADQLDENENYDIEKNNEQNNDPKNTLIELEDEGIDYADMDAEQLDVLMSKNDKKKKFDKKAQDKTKQQSKIKEINKKNAKEVPENAPPVDMVTKNDKNEMLTEDLPTKNENETKKDTEEKLPVKQDIFAKINKQNEQKITFKKRIFGSCSDAKGSKSELYGLLQSKEESEAVLLKNKRLFSNEKFSDTPIFDNLKRRLKDLNYDLMTLIQARAFGPINKGKNCIIKSETGSGKTLAYLVPILDKLLKMETKVDRKDGTYVLIICPTREQCIQVLNVYQNLMRFLPWIVCGMLVGGESISHEKARIRKGLNIVIGTPGRILYHFKNTDNFKRLSKLQFQIFEECDRTLDLGFKKEVDEILECLHSQMDLNKLCKLLVAASFNHNLENLCLEGQGLEENNSNLEQIGRESVGSMQEMIESIEIPAALKQNFQVIGERQKLTFLISLLSEMAQTKGIIFVSTADTANFLDKLQNNLSFSFENQKAELNGTRVIHPEQRIFKLHGHIKQDERAKIFNDFNKEKHAWLISTDVGCRGLDFKDTEIIILFDVPQDMTDYVNRIGRTARISHAGSSLLFLSYCEELFAEKIIDTFHIYKYNPVPVFDNFYSKVKGGENQWQNTHEYIDGLVRKFVQDRDDKENYYLARRAYNSFCRAYARLRDKECFNLKNLNLMSIAKSYGMAKVKSKDRDTKEEGYDAIADNSLSKYKGRFQPKTKIKSAKMLTNLEFM